MPFTLNPLPATDSASGLRRLAGITSALLAAFVIGFGMHEWRAAAEAQQREMRLVLEITAKAIDRYFGEVRASLGAAAYDLQKPGAMDDLARVQQTLRRFHDAHPEAASITLSRRSDGKVLASSLTTATQDLPANRAQGGHTIFARATDEAALANKLVLGRPIVGAMVQRWVFPMAHMVYGPDQRIVAVLTMAMPVDFVQAFWSAAPLSDAMALGLIRDDGFLLSRWPLPRDQPLEVVYGAPRTGTLQRHITAAGFPATGYVEGRNELANEAMANVIRRLPDFGVTTFVSMPLREVRSAWWHKVRVPYLLAFILAAGAYLGYRAILLRQIALEQDRRHAEVLARTSKAKSDFIAQMSHELRTPLNAVVGLSELMALERRDALSPQQLERVALIQRAGQHLLTLINDLLDLSAIEAGVLKMSPATINVVELLEEAAQELAPMGAKRQVEVVVRHRLDAGQEIHADRTRLKQVLLNLLSNAVKYNGEGQCVVLEGSASSGVLHIAVQDTGPGLTPQQVKSLFQPFNRLGRDGTTVGTGIGLAITKRLVEHLGGRLSVHTEVGRGSRFEVTLPVAGAPGDTQAREAHVDDAQALDAPTLTAIALGRPLRVLYVDDDEVNRIIVAGYLQLVPNITLELAADGAEFLALARACTPDLMLIDMMMPRMDGLAVMHEVRADTRLRNTPCVAISANAMPVEIRAARAAGFDGYVTKPISAATLHAELARVLR